MREDRIELLYDHGLQGEALMYITEGYVERSDAGQAIVCAMRERELLVGVSD